MAWLEERGGSFHIGVRVGTRKLKRSLKTADRKEAESYKARVERRLTLIEQSDLTVPADADLLDFLLEAKPKVSVSTISQPKSATLTEIAERYLAANPVGTLEAETLRIIRLHVRHLLKVLKPSFCLDCLRFADLQAYVDARSKDAGRGGRTLSCVTIRKEIATLSAIWNWAIKMELVRGAFPNRGLRYQKSTEKPPFQTVVEIERRISQGRLTKSEKAELWSCVYLTTADLDDVLNTIEQYATAEFLYPMAVMAAHTGARRSELVRSELSDIDLAGNSILLREKKRTRSKSTTRRVPLTAKLRSLLEPLVQQAKGRFTFHQPDRPLIPDDASYHLNQTLAGSRWSNLPGWHVFRHSFISICASRGVDQRMIDAWSGHQTEEMRKRYRHLFPDAQQAALQTVFG
ncbi:MAG: tyrosine-type recombinase/integrase [Planctomycetaceae bacterium]|nr:tyrosine-type recombinase/integrase [Planctomycetaceae bacterium]